MSMRIVVWGLIGAGSAACGGGGSGVPSDKPLASLSLHEIVALCTYFDEVDGPRRRVDCGAVTFYAGDSLRQCRDDVRRISAEFPSCAATVSDIEACATDLATLTDLQMCAEGARPASCASLFEPGCFGAASGVSRGKLLVSLSDDEITSLCDYAYEVKGPERTIKCHRDRSVTIGEGHPEDCVRSIEAVQDLASSCTLTVQDVEDCVAARAALTDEQVCSEEAAPPPACQVLFNGGCDG